MSKVVGYWTDLSSVQLDDNTSTTWIQAMPVGKYQHPVYGEIDFSPERLTKFANSVATKVRGQDLDIDYDHKDKENIAAGWIKAAEVRGADGLWIEVDLTPRAREHLKNKEYRYFSPEFVDEWTDPVTGAVHTDVLNGGALTNRPFLKDILPVNLSDLFKGGTVNGTKAGEGGSGAGTGTPQLTDVQQLGKLLGVEGDGISVGQILGAVQATQKLNQGGTTQAPAAPVTTTTPGVKVAVAPGEALSLAERNTKLMEMVNQLQTANILAEIDLKLQQLSEGGGPVLAPVAKDEAREILLAAAPNKALTEKLFAFLERVARGTATVDLSEYGSARVTGKSPVKAFSDAVAHAQGEFKLTYSEALAKVSKERPELYQDFRNAQLEGVA